MTEMIGQQFNYLFERIYSLMEQVMTEQDEHEIPEVIHAVSEFMRHVKTTSAFEVEDAPSDTYFEAGYHDSIAVFYPFEHNQLEFDAKDIRRYKHAWTAFLSCISTARLSRKTVEQAHKLLTETNQLF